MTERARAAAEELVHGWMSLFVVGEPVPSATLQYHDAMDVLTQWSHLDKAEAIAKYREQAEEIARLRGVLAMTRAHDPKRK